MNRVRVFIFFIFIFSLSVSLSAESFFNPSYTVSGRETAMGGPHAALNDDIRTIFTNPAGLAGVESQIRFSEISLQLSGSVFTMASALIEGLSSDSEDLVSTILGSGLLDSGSIYSGFTLTGPLSFAYAGNGLGFSISDTVNVVLDVPGITSNITADVNADVLLSGGYAYRFFLPEKSGLTLDAGILLKGLLRGESQLEVPLLSLLDADDFGVDSLLDDYPLDLSVGIGFDAGLRLSWKEVISLGISALDIYSPAFISRYSSINAFLGSPAEGQSSDSVEQPGSTIPMNLSAGILYSPFLGRLEPYLSNLKIVLDYSDILDFVVNPDEATNPWLHVGLGFEVGLLEILTLRGGFYQGLFNAGLGLDLNILQLNASMFGRELSSEPGFNPVYNIALSIDFIY